MITITACIWHCCSSSFWKSGCTKALLCLRSLTDAAGASPSKYSRQYVRIPVESGQSVSLPRDRGSGLNRMIHSDISLPYGYKYPNLVIKCSPFCNGQWAALKHHSGLKSCKSVQLVTDEMWTGKRSCKENGPSVWKKKRSEPVVYSFCAVSADGFFWT